MIISFDLDDTLIPGTIQFNTEPQTLLHKLTGTQPLRAGTIQLMKALKEQGHKIYIYTTSLRSIPKIRWLFLSHGISINKIINQKTHNEVLKERSNLHSKYPPAFDIDWHIDDSKGVALEGFRHNFKTIIITGDHRDWQNYILSQIADS